PVPARRAAGRAREAAALPRRARRRGRTRSRSRVRGGLGAGPRGDRAGVRRVAREGRAALKDHRAATMTQFITLIGTGPDEPRSAMSPQTVYVPGGNVTGNVVGALAVRDEASRQSVAARAPGRFFELQPSGNVFGHMH